MFDLQTHYPYLEDINEAVLRLLPRQGGGRVLDVGCGRAALGEALVQRGFEVWGVEQSPEATPVAEKRLHRLIPEDLLLALEKLRNERFDYVVFSDVLEHLPDPLKVLREYTALLAPGGRVVVSVPNVANWEQRLRLAAGVFDYQETGVMDKTHLRFFTLDTARQLLSEAGLDVVAQDFTPHLVRAALPLIKRVLRGGDGGERAIIDSPAYRIYQKLIYPIEYAFSRTRTQLFAFRIVLVGSKGTTH